jgi:hypothetical protein
MCTWTRNRYTVTGKNGFNLKNVCGHLDALPRFHQLCPEREAFARRYGMQGNVGCKKEEIIREVEGLCPECRIKQLEKNRKERVKMGVDRVTEGLRKGYGNPLLESEKKKKKDVGKGKEKGQAEVVEGSGEAQEEQEEEDEDDTSMDPELEVVLFGGLTTGEEDELTLDNPEDVEPEDLAPQVNEPVAPQGAPQAVMVEPVNDKSADAETDVPADNTSSEKQNSSTSTSAKDVPDPKPKAQKRKRAAAKVPDASKFGGQDEDEDVDEEMPKLAGGGRKKRVRRAAA